jgi:hypothetical protein
VWRFAATSDKLLAMVAGGERGLAGKRDRALLLLGFALAARRSELVALDVADLAECPEGLRVTIRRSKTDQEGAGAVVAVCRGSIACPVAAVKDWLAAANRRRASRGGRNARAGHVDSDYGGISGDDQLAQGHRCLRITARHIGNGGPSMRPIRRRWI